LADTVDKCSEGKKVERIENVIVVDGHDLGLDKRGPILNSNNRKSHNFGVNRGALFPSSVAKGPKFRPQNSKGALQKFVRPEKIGGRIFSRFA
jgi:hypothetical protein